MTFLQYGVLGLAAGAVYALLAAGIVVAYRATGVLNFAHASIGVAGAYVYFASAELWHLPVGVALLLGLLTGGSLAVVAHRLVFAPIGRAPQVVKLLVSLGLAGVVQGGIGIGMRLMGQQRSGRLTTGYRRHALLALDRGVSIAGAMVPWQRVATVALGLGVAIGMAVLLRRSAFGVQVRALAQNPNAARLAGIDEGRVQRRVWALSGASAALAAVMVLPFVTLNPLALEGFQLKALAAALLGGFASLPAALAGGLGLGVVQELLVGAPAPLNGMRGVLSTALVLLLLLVRVERFFVSPQEARALEGDARGFTAGARSPAIGPARNWLVALVVIGLVSLGLSGFWAFVATRTLVYALLALSLVVLTGWSGQVSLMPGTFCGVGACLTWVLGAKLGYPFPIVVPLAALATVPVCALVGMAALRLRPLYLAVGTVALAGLFEETLFRQGWFANGGHPMTLVRPVLLRGDHAFALAALIIAGGLFVFTAAMARTRTGRALRMVRDNDRAAAAGGVNPVKYRLLAFTISAIYAGVAGSLFAYLLGTFDSSAFGFLVLSLAAFGLSAAGGIRSPIGSLVGAFLFVYLTEIFRTSGSVDDLSTIAVGAGVILAMSRDPDGLVGLGQRLAARLGMGRDGVGLDMGVRGAA